MNIRRKSPCLRKIGRKVEIKRKVSEKDAFSIFMAPKSPNVPKLVLVCRAG